MTERRDRDPRLTATLVLIAGVSGVLRLLPLLGAKGTAAVAADYDEGVYFSAASLLARGVLPYRDFAFVHPPGLLELLSLPASLARVLGAARAFGLARILMGVVGAANAYLVGRIAARWVGPAAGVTAAVLYATFPEAIGVERGVFLEPLLNLACLGFALAWLALVETTGERRGASFLAGALFGLALSIKLTAALWGFAALAAAPGVLRRKDLAWMAFGGLVAGAVLVGPLALLSPERFFTQTVLFHLTRPRDGITIPAHRWGPILGNGHGLASALAVAGLGGAFALRRLRTTSAFRLLATSWVLTLLFLLYSRTYWTQYNPFLAVTTCVLAGAAVGALSSLHAVAGRVAVAVIAAIVVVPAWNSVRATCSSPDPTAAAVVDAIRQTVPDDARLLAFEPAFGLLAGHLPEPDAAEGALVDPYGAMLWRASAVRPRIGNATAAFHSDPAQAYVQAYLRGVDYVLLTPRGRWQLSPASLAAFRSRFTMVHPAAGMELWKRREVGRPPP